MIEDHCDYVNLSNKEPGVYFEYSKISIKDGQVIATSKDVSSVIPVSLYSSVVLGPGTSITSEAVKVMSKRECGIIFAGGYGLPAYGATLNYRTPKHKLNQYSVMSNNLKRMKAGRLLLAERDSVCAEFSLPRFDLEEIKRSRSVQDLLLVEARWAKKTIRNLSDTYGSDKREALKLVNHFSYSAVLPSIVHLGLDPNIGVLHGKNRGGGLVFDISDVYKPWISLSFCFEAKSLDASLLKREFSARCYKMGLQDRTIDLLRRLYR